LPADTFLGSKYRRNAARKMLKKRKDRGEENEKAGKEKEGSTLLG